MNTTTIYKKTQINIIKYKLEMSLKKIIKSSRLD